MKKKLKVKKAALGSMMKAANKMVRPVKQPRPIPVKQPRPIPVKQPLPSPVKQTGPSIQLGIGPGGQPLPSPGMQQPANSFGGLADAILRQQPRPGVQPFPTIPAVSGPLGSTALPSAPGPLGGQFKLTHDIVRSPAPMQQQAAPAQRVSTMKKGGIVRGGRSEIKGTRPAKLY
jgi:hypothetical protein